MPYSHLRKLQSFITHLVVTQLAYMAEQRAEPHKQLPGVAIGTVFATCIISIYAVSVLAQAGNIRVVTARAGVGAVLKTRAANGTELTTQARSGSANRTITSEGHGSVWTAESGNQSVLSSSSYGRGGDMFTNMARGKRIVFLRYRSVRTISCMFYGQQGF